MEGLWLGGWAWAQHSFDTFISDEELIDDYNEKDYTLPQEPIGGNCNKVLLSSPWGWFSMRSPTPSYHHRFTQLMFRDQYEVQKFCCISDDVAMVQCRHADSRGSCVKDVFVGAMTTPYARLGLCDLIDKPHKCVLYWDPNNVIFTSQPGEWVPALGPYLSELIDEMNGQLPWRGRGGLHHSLSPGFQNATLTTQWQKADKAQWSTGYHSRQFQRHQKCNNSQEIYTCHLFSTSAINNHHCKWFWKDCPDLRASKFSTSHTSCNSFRTISLANFVA